MRRSVSSTGRSLPSGVSSRVHCAGGSPLPCRHSWVAACKVSRSEGTSIVRWLAPLSVSGVRPPRRINAVLASSGWSSRWSQAGTAMACSISACRTSVLPGGCGEVTHGVFSTDGPPARSGHHGPGRAARCSLPAGIGRRDRLAAARAAPGGRLARATKSASLRTICALKRCPLGRRMAPCGDSRSLDSSMPGRRSATGTATSARASASASSSAP